MDQSFLLLCSSIQCIDVAVQICCCSRHKRTEMSCESHLTPVVSTGSPSAIGQSEHSAPRPAGTTTGRLCLFLQSYHKNYGDFVNKVTHLSSYLLIPPPGCCDSSGLDPGAVTQNMSRPLTYPWLHPLAPPQSVDVTGHGAGRQRGGGAAAATGRAAPGGSDTDASEGGRANQRESRARQQEEQ